MVTRHRFDCIYVCFILSAGKGCTVYDVVVNPQFMEKMQTSELFKTFFLTVMMEGLEQKYDTELSRGTVKVLNFWDTLNIQTL